MPRSAIRGRSGKSGASHWGVIRRSRERMLELFWSPNLTESVARRIARFEGLDLDPCHKDPRQAAVYLCLHYSNFEWLSQFGAYYDRSTDR